MYHLVKVSSDELIQWDYGSVFIKVRAEVGANFKCIFQDETSTTIDLAWVSSVALIKVT